MSDVETVGESGLSQVRKFVTDLFVQRQSWKIQLAKKERQYQDPHLVSGGSTLKTRSWCLLTTRKWGDSCRTTSWEHKILILLNKSCCYYLVQMCITSGYILIVPFCFDETGHSVHHPSSQRVSQGHHAVLEQLILHQMGIIAQVWNKVSKKNTRFKKILPQCEGTYQWNSFSLHKIKESNLEILVFLTSNTFLHLINLNIFLLRQNQ